MLPDRVFLIAAAAAAAGLWFSLRYLLLWGRLVVRKFRRGVPYLWGSAQRAFLLFIPSVVVLACGVLLGAAGYGLRDYQRLSEMELVGTLEMRERGPAGTGLRFRPGAGYPGEVREPEAVLTSGRWSVSGQFILWSRPLQWLGLRDSHRVAWLLSVDDPSDIPAPDRIARQPLVAPGSDRMWNLLDGWGQRLKLVETRTFQSPWQSGTFETIDLYAFPGGYLLVRPEPGS